MHPLELLFISLTVWALGGTGLLIFLIWKMGPEGRFFLGENMKRGGAILALHTGAVTEYLHVNEDEGYLKGNPKNYYFLPNLLKKKEDSKVKTYNEILKFRSILKGSRKPIYHASQSSCLAANPTLLGTLAEYSNKEELEKLVEDDKASIVVPWGVDELEEYVKSSYPASKQKRSYREGYLEGIGYKEPRNLKQYVVPLMAIVALIVFVMILSRGDMLRSLLGGFGGIFG